MFKQFVASNVCFIMPLPTNQIQHKESTPKGKRWLSDSKCSQSGWGTWSCWQCVYTDIYRYIILCIYIYIYTKVFYTYTVNYRRGKCRPANKHVTSCCLFPFGLAKSILTSARMSLSFNRCCPPVKKTIYIYVRERERSAQNLNWKMRFFVKVIVFGSSLSGLSFYSISWLHHPHPLANCTAESLFTPPLRVLGIFDCPALSFPALQLYGGCGVIPANATANHSCTILSPAQKQVLNSVCWRKPGWALTATCSMPFIHSPASAQKTIDLVQRLCLGYLHLG